MSEDLAALRGENLALRQRLAALERQVGGDGAELLRSVLEAMPAIITRLDPECRVQFLNRYLPGYCPETVVGSPVYDFIAAADVPVVRAAIEQVLKTGERTSYRIVGSGAHGGTSDYETFVVPMTEADGRRSVCLVSLDISEHVERERALQRSEEALRIAVAATGMGLWRWNAVTDETTWNDVMFELTGSAEPLSPARWTATLAHPDDRKELTLAAAQMDEHPDQIWRMHRIVRPDGTTRWVVPSGSIVRDERGAITALIGGILDVTEQRATEERLRQTQKLEALGSLTAGVAHNFNNMLAIIVPFLDSAVSEANALDPELAATALHAAHRAAEMVRQLMTLAVGRPAGHKASCELHKVARAAVDICRHLFKDHIGLELDVADGEYPLLCDDTAIEQALVNLLLNARDALLDVERAAPRIRIAIERVHAGDVPVFPGRRPQDYARIQVSDNGSGMDELTRARLFEPFFTTKGPGRGTGLGLATTHAVVREHGGYIACSSVLGVGTTFSIYLPLDVASSAARELARVELRPDHPLCVLVVEDDAMVRRTTVTLLLAGGHEPYEVASGAEALTALGSGLAADIVLLDRSLPNAPGSAFLSRIRELRPKAKIVYFTGGEVPEEERSQVDAVLYKPLAARSLTSALEALMQESSTSSERQSQ